MFKFRYIYFLILAMVLTNVSAQEENPYLSYDVPSQNLLKYNRFLINPTFSTVREDKSYVNLLHRNQSVNFSDNNQNYFLSYSGRVNDRTGLGISVYQQTAGTLTNYGVLANYAYGIKLSDKTNFTFGANLSYYASGLDQNRINAADPDDPFLNGQKDNLLQFQPGVNLSSGKFDVGLYAENLFDYNLKSSESVSEFAEKTFSGHLQYTHQFNTTAGVLEQGRLMPLARVRKIGEDKIVLGGSLILDLPKLGWLQAGYDDHYGAAAGLGFNLNKRLSLGYTMEKSVAGNFDNFGVTHEISLAYAFTPNLTEDRVMLEDTDDLVENPEEMLLETDEVVSSEKIEELKRKLAENDEILAELMFRQDSLEVNRQKDLEKRFEMVMRMVRSETKGKRPDIEEKAKKMYFINNNTALVDTSNKRPIGIENTFPTKKPQAIAAKKPVTVKDAVANNATQPVSKNKTLSTVKSRTFKNLAGVADGYYVVANVYKGKGYLNKFITELDKKGIKAGYIENQNNGLKYVFLKKFDTWQEAVAAHNSNMNGSYKDQMWIMNVDNSSYSDKRYASSDKVPSKFPASTRTKNVVAKDKLVSRVPKSKTVKFNGVGSGFYIIANVFANANNANRFVKLLNSQGLNASYFINPENNYRYVYLKKHGSWNNALTSYYSKINSSYQDKMWIMRVSQNQIT